MSRRLWSDSCRLLLTRPASSRRVWRYCQWQPSATVQALNAPSCRSVTGAQTSSPTALRPARVPPTRDSGSRGAEALERYGGSQRGITLLHRVRHVFALCCAAPQAHSNRAPRLPVLVHCSAGKTRSPSVVAVYLMKHRGYSLRSAMQLLRSKRPRARANDHAAACPHPATPLAPLCPALWCPRPPRRTPLSQLPPPRTLAPDWGPQLLVRRHNAAVAWHDAGLPNRELLAAID